MSSKFIIRLYKLISREHFPMTLSFIFNAILQLLYVYTLNCLSSYYLHIRLKRIRFSKRDCSQVNVLIVEIVN